MAATKPHSFHFGNRIKLSASTVARVSMDFTLKWNFFTLVPITAIRASPFFVSACLRLERCNPQTASPFILFTYTIVCSGINMLFHLFFLLPSAHCETPALRLLYPLREWIADMSRVCEQIQRQPERYFVVKAWRRSPRVFSQNEIVVWNCQNFFFSYIKN